MNKTSLLEIAKKLNKPRQNCMKRKKQLEEAIKDTITTYKEIIFSSDTSTCIACQDEVDGRHDEKTRMGGTSKIFCEGWSYNDR